MQFAYDREAMPVGNCNHGELLNGCTGITFPPFEIGNVKCEKKSVCVAGGRNYGGSGLGDTKCEAGETVGIEVTCFSVQGATALHIRVRGPTCCKQTHITIINLTVFASCMWLVLNTKIKSCST
jgi:hypothetical protein